MPQRKQTTTKRVDMLLTCVGRRVELLRAFRRAGDALGLSLRIHGADASPLSPAIHCVDIPHRVPSIRSGKYVDSLLKLVKRHGISLLIPLIDTELAPIAEARERFAAVNCAALISAPSVVAICNDKIATYEMLTKAKIDTPKTWRWSEVLDRKHHAFPYFLKPRAGSAGVGSFVIRNAEELHALGGRVTDAIVQEFVEGIEHTLDVYNGLDGLPRCVVPRKRLEVRNGEVSKGLTVKDPEIMAVGKKVAEVLGECRGVVTVQCMVTPEKRIRVIEINPRFGGGAPLAIHAGADFPKWILQELTGTKPRINPHGFRNDVAMLRFDESVFVPNASKRCGIA